MQAAHVAADADAVDVALRQLPPGAERLLRARFGIGMATRSRSATFALPPRRVRQLEASAFRKLRLNAMGASPS